MAELIQSQNELGARNKSFKNIFSHDKSDIMNVQLKTGEGMPEHDSKHAIFIIVRSGVVVFECSGDQYVLSDSDVLFLDPSERHSVEAREDVDFLIVFLK